METDYLTLIIQSLAVLAALAIAAYRIWQQRKEMASVRTRVGTFSTEALLVLYGDILTTDDVRGVIKAEIIKRTSSRLVISLTHETRKSPKRRSLGLSPVRTA